MNGFTTSFNIWREETLLGSAGARYRPKGVVQINYQPDAITTWRTEDPLRAPRENKTLHQVTRITISREHVNYSTYDDLWLNALGDGNTKTTSVAGYDIFTRERSDNPAPQSFGLQFVLPDGNQRQFNGCAISRFEILIEAGRIVQEEIELVALQSVEFTGAIAAATDYQNAILDTRSSINARHSFQPGTAWTTTDDDAVVRTISCQMIWSRSVQAAQFNAEGQATRFKVDGSWELVGRSRVITPIYWQALQSTTRAMMQTRIGAAYGEVGSFYQIDAAVDAKIAGHALLAEGDIDYLIDWMAIRPAGAREHYILKNYRKL